MAEHEPLKYEVVIFWLDKDDAYIANVPELPCCLLMARLTKRH